MFAFGSVELLLVGGSFLALVLWRFFGSARWVRVDDTHVVTVEPLEVPLTRLLSGLSATRLAMGPGHTWTLTVRRIPPWVPVLAVAMAVLGPPYWAFGVLALALAREQQDLQILLRPGTDASELIVTGTTRLDVLRALRAAASELSSRSDAGSDP